MMFYAWYKQVGVGSWESGDSWDKGMGGQFKIQNSKFKIPTPDSRLPTPQYGRTAVRPYRLRGSDAQDSSASARFPTPCSQRTTLY
jgi:hypothetical protein